MTDLTPSSGVCPLCFTPLVKNTCPACKLKNRKLYDNPDYLPMYTLLKGRYRIGGAIGEGGFGITYAAFDKLLCKRVAIKEYFPSSRVKRGEGGGIVPLDDDSRISFINSKRTFAEEAKKMASLRNLKGIANVLDFFAERGTMYIVMDYIDGITLDHFLKKSGKLPFAEAYKLLRPVLYALDLLHNAGFVHGDIAPDNIMLTAEGAMLLDFGSTVHSEVFTGSRRVTLKVNFAPPEQFNAGKVLTPATDVYAFGATLYRSVCGLFPPPSTARLTGDTLKKPLSCAKMSQVENDTLLKCLALNAADRFANMPQLIETMDYAVMDDPLTKSTKYTKLLNKFLGIK